MFNLHSDFAVYNLAILTVVGTIAALSGYVLMRRKFFKKVKEGEIRERELNKRVFESEILREISEKIGYSLNAQKLVEIITGSIGKLMSYSSVSYLIVGVEGEIKFNCSLIEAMSEEYVKKVKRKTMASYIEMTGEPILDSEVEEDVTGVVTEGDKKEEILSFFNLPIVVLGKVVSVVNVSSASVDQYDEKTTDVLYRIAKHGSQAVSRLLEIIENEKGRLVQAVESLSDGLLMVDSDFKVVLINKKLCNILSVNHKSTLLEIVQALSGQIDLRTMLESAGSFGDDKVKPSEITIKEKVLQVYAAKVVDQQGLKPMGIAVTFHDITDAKSLERLRSDFTAVMVHELRAPLTTIKSTVELIDEDPTLMTAEELKHHLQVVESTSQSMLELVNDLLDVAKLESGKFEVVCERADLAVDLNERIEAFTPVAEAKNLKITVSVEEDLPEGYYDRVRVKQVVNNLLSNAIKYTKSGEITVKAVEERLNSQPVDILVSISDTGIGIESGEAERLFSRFVQLKSGHNMGGEKSSGLGLFISKGIIEAIGGKIWVESPGTGLGSTFYFTIPLGRSKEKENEEDERIIFSTKKIAQA